MINGADQSRNPGRITSSPSSVNTTSNCSHFESWDMDDPAGSAERVAKDFEDTYPKPILRDTAGKELDPTNWAAARAAAPEDERKQYFIDSTDQLAAMLMNLKLLSQFLHDKHDIVCCSKEVLEPVNLVTRAHTKRNKPLSPAVLAAARIDGQTLFVPAELGEPISSADREFVQQVQEPLFEHIRKIWLQFEDAAHIALGENPKRKQIRTFRELCRDKIRPLLMDSPFTARAIVEPHTEGDFRIINMILHDDIHRGNNLYGVLVNAVHLLDPVAQAHHYRIKALEELIALEAARHAASPAHDQSFHILNLSLIHI